MLTQPTLIEPIPEGMGRGWSLFVNEKPILDVRELQLVNPKFGTLTYGKSPSGKYDQWGFHEVGGGGSVIVPFVRIRHMLYVGVLEQMRPLQDKIGPVLNVPRGFMDPKETHFETAVRETREEAGIDSASRIIELRGDPGNSNSAFFETWGDGEGIHFWAIEMEASEVERISGTRTLRIRNELLRPVSKMAEGIMKSVFIPWYDALTVGDMMTLSAVGRLIGHLKLEGEVHLQLF